MSKLLMFHGRECPHCRAMMPLVERLEKETGAVVDKLEVWHDRDNAEKMRGHRNRLSSACGGRLLVPAFLNLDTNQALCGETSYEALKTWAGR